MIREETRTILSCDRLSRKYGYEYDDTLYRCGNQFILTGSMPITIINIAKEMGWKFAGEEAICPDCLKYLKQFGEHEPKDIDNSKWLDKQA